MAKAAADRAAVSRLPVSDRKDGLRQQRQAPLDQLRKLDRALRRHRADRQLAALLANVGQTLDPVEVDQVIRIGNAQVEHRHQRLATGENPGVVEFPQVAERFAERSRQVVLERWRLHRPLPSRRAGSGSRAR